MSIELSWYNFGMFLSWVIDTIKVQTSFTLIVLQRQLHEWQCEQFEWEQKKGFI